MALRQRWRYIRSMTDNRYRQIGVVGAGRAGCALALALAAHSEKPLLLYNRSPERMRDALAQVRNARSAPLAMLGEASDLIVIAVSDDAIGSVARQLAQFIPRKRPPFVFHISGGSGAEVLDPLRARGASTAAIHPAMTFTGAPAAEMARMAGARFAVTAQDEDAMASAKAVIQSLDGIPVEIAEQYRPLYHAALCHAANHLVTLLSGSARALETAGVDAPYPLLAPLVRAAMENSIARGFAALSGPLLRGDAGTIENHLDALSRDCQEVLPAYRAMALATLDELQRSGKRAPPPQCEGSGEGIAELAYRITEYGAKDEEHR